MSVSSACCEEPDPIRWRPTASSRMTGAVVAGRADEHGHAGEHVLEDRERRDRARPRTSSPAWPATRPPPPRPARRLPTRRGRQPRSGRAPGRRRTPSRRIRSRRRGPPPSAIAFEQRATAALVAVADRLLPAPDRVLDGAPGRALDPVEEQPQRVDAARLAAEVLEQHGAPSATRRRRAPRQTRPHDAIALVEPDWHRHPRRVGAAASRDRTGRARRAARRYSPCGDELAEAALPPLRRSSPTPPGTRNAPELLRPQVADEYLVRRHSRAPARRCAGR